MTSNNIILYAITGESLAKQAANNQLALRRTHSFETDKT